VILPGSPDLVSLLPELIVAALAVVLILADAFMRRGQSRALTWVALVFLVAALASAIALFNYGRVENFSGMLVRDQFSTFFQIIALIAAILAVLISPSYIESKGLPLGEYYAIMAMSTLGMMVVAAAGDLVTIFVGIELMTIAVYILTGFAKFDRESSEGALKYFLLGIFGTAILVYGMAWTYGMTGATNLRAIAMFLTTANLNNPGLILGLLLLIGGLAFKVAAVPFHMWTPDAYQGAPTPVTAFMSVAVKAASFAAMLRILIGALGAMHAQWTIAIIVLAIVTMTLGNVVAIAQKNVKRMLAYSTIAHTGYILVGVAAYTGFSNGNSAAVEGVLYYTFVYVFMNIGAFAIIAWLQRNGGGDKLDDFSGLAAWAPLPAIAMAICLISLTGIPPTVGFLGKFYIFLAAVKSDLVWLAVIGVLNSAISAFYYLRVIVYMYMREPEKQLARKPSPMLMTGIVIAALAALFFGLYSTPIFDLARSASAMIF
jgi:NADH-quinone oxidoreductase subunit N